MSDMDSQEHVPVEADLYMGYGATGAQREAVRCYAENLLVILEIVHGNQDRAVELLRKRFVPRGKARLLDGRKIDIPDEVLIESAWHVMSEDSLLEIPHGPTRSAAIGRRTQLRARKDLVSGGTADSLGADDLPEFEYDHRAVSRLSKTDPWKRLSREPLDHSQAEGPEFERSEELLMRRFHEEARTDEMRLALFLMARGMTASQACGEAGVSRSDFRGFQARVRKSIAA